MSGRDRVQARGLRWGSGGPSFLLEKPLPGYRGEGALIPSGGKKIGMPTRVFLYTVDQLSVMLDLDEATIKRSYLFFEGRSTGVRARDLMTARNIAQPGEKPDWRIAEREFIRWMRYKGFKHYERSTFTN